MATKIVSYDEWSHNEDKYIYVSWTEPNHAIVFDKEGIPDKIWEILKVLDNKVSDAKSTTYNAYYP